MHGLPSQYVKDMTASLCTSTGAGAAGSAKTSDSAALPSAKAVLQEVLARFLTVSKVSVY
jgi:hypothetical protein